MSSAGEDHCHVVAVGDLDGDGRDAESLFRHGGGVLEPARFGRERGAAGAFYQRLGHPTLFACEERFAAIAGHGVEATVDGRHVAGVVLDSAGG